MDKADKLMMSNYMGVVRRNTLTLWDMVKDLKDKETAKAVSHVVEDLNYASDDLNDTLSRL